MVRHPFVLIVVDVVLAVVLGPFTVWIFGLPDFSDPTKGFEARGSKITTWELATSNIYHQMYANKEKELFSYPKNFSLLKSPTANHSQVSARNRRSVGFKLTPLQDCLMKESSKLDIYDSVIVVTSKTGQNIFTASHLRSICRLQDSISAYPWPRKSCHPLSLPLFVAALNNKSSCGEITDSDVRTVLALLKQCARYYFNGKLTRECADPRACPDVPPQCGAMNFVYVILHVMTGEGFLEGGNRTLSELDFSVIIVSRYWYNYDADVLTEFFKATFDGKVVEDGDVIAPAVRMNIEQQVFGLYVKRDITLYVMAMAMVVVVLLLYLQSFVLMVAIVANVIITLCLSFFIYYYVIQLNFFPFINLIAALLLIAISADDVFIIYDLWRKEMRTNPESSYETIMSETLRKGGLSIFVTSLTTSASLLANVASQITTIRCFGIFAGICILINFILMITWIPALIVLIEKVFNHCIADESFGAIRRCSGRMTKASDKFWGVFMVKVITFGSPVWVVVLIVAGGLGLIAVFVKPGLRLPEDNYVKVFNPENPFEIYRRDYKNRMRFERQLLSSHTVRIQYVWGVDGVDNGDLLDPDKRGGLVYTPLDVYTEEARSWLKQFCADLKAQPFVRRADSRYECYFDVLERLMTGTCPEKIDISPCCGLPAMPDAERTEMCVKHIAGALKGNMSRLSGTEVLGLPIFDSKGDVKIFSYIFHTTTLWTPNHAEIGKFLKQVEEFSERQLASAPGRLKEGWFASFGGFQLVFYDLQNAISFGTMTGMGLSLASSFLVLLGTSLNVVIALYAIFTITLIIGATVGSLVFLGWELNVTESLTITMSLGLAVDFTIHYGVAYLLVKSDSRGERIRDTVVTVSSAISMAALTTFISGACVLGSRVLAYRQFGLFLVFVMFYSWTLSTFLFLPLCYGIGPLRNTGSIRGLFACCRRRHRTREGGLPNSEATPARYDGAPADGRLGTNPVFFRTPDPPRLAPLSALGSLDAKLTASSGPRSSPVHTSRASSQLVSGGSDYDDQRVKSRRSRHYPDDPQSARSSPQLALEDQRVKSRRSRHHPEDPQSARSSPHLALDDQRVKSRRSRHYPEDPQSARSSPHLALDDQRVKSRRSRHYPEDPQSARSSPHLAPEDQRVKSRRSRHHPENPQSARSSPHLALEDQRLKSRRSRHYPEDPQSARSSPWLAPERHRRSGHYSEDERSARSSPSSYMSRSGYGRGLYPDEARRAGPSRR